MSRQITKEERGSLLRLLKSDDWDIILRLLNEQEMEWNSQPTGGNTEFEVIRAVYKKEGKVEGVKEFFEILEQHTQ